MDINLPDLKNLDYDQLKQVNAAIKAELDEKASAARGAALDTIVALLVEFEITPAELNKAARGKMSAKASAKKSPPKYANPEDPTQTWTGRGASPAWIKDVPKDQREPFLIENQKAHQAPAPEGEETPIQESTEYQNGAGEGEGTEGLFNENAAE